jgi:hypothetical protein
LRRLVRPVSSVTATVLGIWGDDPGVTLSCAATDGRCAITRSDIPNRTTKVTFTVTVPAHPDGPMPSDAFTVLLEGLRYRH